METPPARTLSPAARWKALSSANRRRIVLGSLVALALGARDLMLFVVATGLFALAELGSAAQNRASAA